MNNLRALLWGWWVLWGCAAWGAPAGRADLIGYSLTRAHQLAEARANRLPPETTLALTDLIGFALDGDDVVVIGRRRPEGTPLGPDGVAQMLRSAALGGLTGPGVSLEPDPHDTNRMEAVYFGQAGGNCIGQISFTVDFFFKELALGFKPIGIAGLKSYADRLVEERTRHGSAGWEIVTRFWFTPAYLPISFTDDCWLLGTPNLVVLVETLRAQIDGKPSTNVVDRAAEGFAKEVNHRFAELKSRHREFSDTEALMGSLQVAAFIVQKCPTNQLAYWLTRYQPAPVACPTGTNYLRRSLRDAGVDLTLFGGVRAAGMALRLQRGEVAAMKEVVLKSRPADPSIPAWIIPLDEDRLPMPGHLPDDQLRAAQRYLEGTKLRASRHFSDAAVAFDEAAAAAPESVESRFLAAVCRREAATHAGTVERLGEALTEFRHLASRFPHLPEIRHELGVSLSMFGAHAEAAAEFERLVREAPPSPATLYATALSHYRSGHSDLARLRLHECFDLHPRETLAGEAAQLLRQLDSPRDTARTLLYENDLFSCEYPAHWRVLAGDEARHLLSGAPSADGIVAAFLCPENPDCNVVITSRPLPPHRFTTAELGRALARAEQQIQSSRTDYHRIAGQVLEGDGSGYLLRFTCRRLGRVFRQSVTTHVVRTSAITVTCSAPDEDFDRRYQEAFRLAEAIQIEAAAH